jgi:hypothetical protein
MEKIMENAAAKCNRAMRLRGNAGKRSFLYTNRLYTKLKDLKNFLCKNSKTTDNRC